MRDIDNSKSIQFSDLFKTDNFNNHLKEILKTYTIMKTLIIKNFDIILTVAFVVFTAFMVVYNYINSAYYCLAI